MVVFLLSSFIGFLIFQIVKIVEVSSYKTDVVVYKFGKFLLIRTSRNIRVHVISSIIICIILVTAIIRYYSSAFFGDLYGFGLMLFDRYAGSILIGFLFGPLFANWLNNVARLKSKETLSSVQVVYGVLLIVLFVAGSLGQETGRIIEGYAKKLTKVSVGGVELGFADTRRSSRASITDNNVVNSAPIAQLTPGTSQGLSAMAELANLIQRDCQYISMTMGGSVDACALDNSTPPTDKLQACASPPTTLDCVQTEHIAAARSAQTLLVDYSKCLLAASELGADSTFIKQRLEGLAPRLREMANPNFENDNRFKARAKATFFNETLALTSYVYSAFMTQKLPRPDDVAFQNLSKGCSPSFALLCGDSEPGTAQFDTCGREITTLSSLSPTEAEFREFKSKNLGNFESSIGSFLKVKNRDKRPYIVLAYAYLTSHLRDYDSALFKLDEWLSLHNSQINQYSTQLQITAYKIHKVRVMTAMLFFTEEWTRFLKSDAPTSLRESNINNISALIDIQTSIPSYQKILDDARRPSSAALQSNFTIPNTYSRKCPSPEEYNVRLLHNFLSQKLLYVYNALRHPEYTITYAPKARAHVLEVVNADLSCIAEKPYDAWGKEILSADALDLYAQILLREASAARKIKGKPAILSELGIALNAARLGRTLVSEAKKEDANLKAKSNNFIAKISITPAYDTYSSIERTIGAIEQAITDVSDDD